MHDTNPLPLLILCGGQSSRMGSPKALLPLNGGTLLDYLAAHTAPSRPLWLADGGNSLPLPERAVRLADALPEKQGPLSAVLSALRQVRRQGLAGVYVMTCDTLIGPEAMIGRLNAAAAPDCETVLMLRSPETAYPLLAYWPSSLSDGLAAYLDGGSRRVMRWVAQIQARDTAMPAAWQPYANFNTPAEFAAALAAWSAQQAV
ncbi:molybdopterin-guanine dinucleotide biosynthesis protein MobA [Kingella potus]|uniref:Molybdopterin-guanine dinucleotide biosynthesis protein MobA n=1 Tax=Kingella potus TaxID=265175 RepID=A0A377R6C0_9NEIS|nr:molybdenum cofactor guanylyltransferase [Kingella potus]UOO99860.1 molybdenum cofactor guanylyltransferase [Kingella potus]STR03115.1 molybdopterin-guanine dinucleotide biosynthesis protein MobA [Kingella potus]